MVVNMTQELLDRYIGGQMQTINLARRYIYRGEIKGIVLMNGWLIVTLSWLARGGGWPPEVEEWVDAVTPGCAAPFSLKDTLARNLGPGLSGEGGDRLRIRPEVNGDFIILYPPDGEKIERPPQVMAGLA